MPSRFVEADEEFIEEKKWEQNPPEKDGLLD